MNERLPYEEQLDQSWETLPLPDENMAWQDMKRRLDEDDDDKIVVPPPRRGCGIGVLLIGLLLIGGLWLLLRPEKWFYKNDETISQKTENKTTKVKTNDSINRIQKENDQPDQLQQQITYDSSLNAPGTNTSLTNSDVKDEVKQHSDLTINSNQSGIRRKPSDNNFKKTKEDQNSEAEFSNTDPTVSKKKMDKINNKEQGNDKKENIKQVDEERIEESVSNIKKKEELDNRIDNSKKQIDTIRIQSDPIKETLTQNDEIKQDSINNTTVDSSFVKTPDVPVKKKKSEKKNDKDKRPIFFAAGLGLHQQIPIAGQKWVTYGSLGRKGILTDYIPSINFRMEKQDRWFLQTEFRYGAPQHTKQFTYEEVTRLDSASQSIITTSTMLKKTFYHQVPLTFNYYVVPGWSVGTGVQWNKFHSAVAEQDVRKQIPGTNNDSLISQKIFKVSADTTGSLEKSWFQGIIQTQYQWKRFSIGARYSFGLEPYIKFTLPNLPLQQEKNSSLQIFLRYELWRSRK